MGQIIDASLGSLRPSRPSSSRPWIQQMFGSDGVFCLSSVCGNSYRERAAILFFFHSRSHLFGKNDSEKTDYGTYVVRRHIFVPPLRDNGGVLRKKSSLLRRSTKHIPNKERRLAKRVYHIDTTTKQSPPCLLSNEMHRMVLLVCSTNNNNNNNNKAVLCSDTLL